MMVENPGSDAGTIQNCGEPIRFAEVGLIGGFAGVSANAGQPVPVKTRLGITSDEPGFHRMAESINDLVRTWAHRINMVVDISHYKTVLLVLKDDQTAELWLDTAAVAMKCIDTRDVAAGTVVFQQNIGDITALQFPCVLFGASDQVFCLSKVLARQ